MIPDKIKKWLSEPYGDEWEHYLICQARISKDPTFEDELIIRFLESLASARAKSEDRRAMLEKHEWCYGHSGYGECEECGGYKDTEN